MTKRISIQHYMPAPVTLAGIFYHTLDDKHRLHVPAELRSKFFATSRKSGKAEALMIKNPDHPSIGVFPPATIAYLTETGKAKPGIFAQGMTVQLDKSGRIFLPKVFEEVISPSTPINKAVIVGCGRFFEIWSEDNWRVEEPKRRETAVSDIRKMFSGEPEPGLFGPH